MIREIVTDDAALSQPCENATAEDAPIAQDLLDTFESLDDAACLAANQIGAPKRIVVCLDLKDRPHVMFNPVMKQALRPAMVVEQCLSRPDQMVSVKRFDWINVDFQELVDGKLVNRKRKYQGWEAQVVQHMIDHCNGKLV